MDDGLIERVRRFADAELFPNADEVDRLGRFPNRQLDRIVEEGFYGLSGPTELGGAGADSATQLAVIEAMAGGCLTTCFVWVQHQGAVAAAVNATGDIHDRFARPLCTGELKAGVAFAHLLRPNVVIEATPDGNGGWVITGTAPWVTGWGYIDVILVAGRHVDVDVGADETGDIVWMLVDATESETLVPRPLQLSAVNSSATDEIRFDHHRVSAERVTHIQPFDRWRSDYDLGLRTNGSLGLGIAERAAALLDEAGFGRPFETELAKVRHHLDTAGPADMPAARADLATLTVRITAALVAGQGGRSILAHQHGQRLAREAMFLLIQGQTAEIKQHQVDNLT